MWYNSSKKTEQYAADIEKQYKVKAKAYQIKITDYDHVVEGINQVIKDFGNLTNIVVGTKL
jgi:sorbose reductase